jgi:hypothetical protein
MKFMNESIFFVIVDFFLIQLLYFFLSKQKKVLNIEWVFLKTILIITKSLKHNSV